MNPFEWPDRRRSGSNLKLIRTAAARVEGPLPTGRTSNKTSAGIRRRLECESAWSHRPFQNSFRALQATRVSAESPAEGRQNPFRKRLDPRAGPCFPRYSES
jgi:hypothetical protein